MMLESMGLNLLFAVLFVAGVVRSSAGTLIDVAFTDASATSKTGFAATGLTTNDFWNTVNPGGLPNLKFVDGTASGASVEISLIERQSYNGSSDPMYDSDLVATSMTLTVTNLSGGVYDFYLYGHGNEDNQNGIYQLTVGSQSYGSEATTNGSGWLSSVWQEGVQYVGFTNVIVPAGQSVNIAVEPGAGGYSVLSGLQMVPLILASNSVPLTINPPTNSFTQINE